MCHRLAELMRALVARQPRCHPLTVTAATAAARARCGDAVADLLGAAKAAADRLGHGIWLTSRWLGYRRLDLDEPIGQPCVDLQQTLWIGCDYRRVMLPRQQGDVHIHYVGMRALPDYGSDSLGRLGL